MNTMLLPILFAFISFHTLKSSELEKKFIPIDSTSSQERSRLCLTKKQPPKKFSSPVDTDDDWIFCEAINDKITPVQEYYTLSPDLTLTESDLQQRLTPQKKSPTPSLAPSAVKQNTSSALPNKLHPDEEIMSPQEFTSITAVNLTLPAASEKSSVTGEKQHSSLMIQSLLSRPYGIYGRHKYKPSPFKMPQSMTMNGRTISPIAPIHSIDDFGSSHIPEKPQAGLRRVITKQPTNADGSEEQSDSDTSSQNSDSDQTQTISGTLYCWLTGSSMYEYSSSKKGK
jgi:hypothetical protein